MNRTYLKIFKKEKWNELKEYVSINLKCKWIYKVYLVYLEYYFFNNYRYR